MKSLAGIALAALVLVAAPRPALTVTVSGHGSVTSRPAGIRCPSHCTTHVGKGSKVTLSASPTSGSAFSHWSAPCGRARTCVLRLTAARTVHAFFRTLPAPPPPPPPAAKAGHYSGAYSDGSVFDFDVQAMVLSHLRFDFNGHCDNGSSLASNPVDVNGSFPVAGDGSVSGHITLNYPNATGTADFAGTLTPTGSGSGTLKIALTFTSGPSCNSTGTWTAQAS